MAQLGDTMIVGDLVVTGKIFPERSENLKDLLDMFYPVGSYYETSDVNFDPAISWGGKWTQDTKGLTTVGAYNSTEDNPGNSRVYLTPGSIKGESEHILTVDELAEHDHFLERQRWFFNDTVHNSGGGAILNYAGDASSASYKGGVRTTGSSQAHNNTQPSIGVIRWHRIA